MGWNVLAGQGPPTSSKVIFATSCCEPLEANSSGFREKNLSVLVSVIGEGLHVFIYLLVFIPSLPKFKRWQDIAFLKQHGRSQVKHCAVVTVLLGLLSPSVSHCGASSCPRKREM